jgi:hypothetical protein
MQGTSGKHDFVKRGVEEPEKKAEQRVLNLKVGHPDVKPKSVQGLNDRDWTVKDGVFNLLSQGRVRVDESHRQLGAGVSRATERWVAWTEAVKDALDHPIQISMGGDSRPWGTWRTAVWARREDRLRRLNKPKMTDRRRALGNFMGVMEMVHGL